MIHIDATGLEVRYLVINGLYFADVLLLSEGGEVNDEI